ncbi:MAG: hypothetical protein U0169_01815 [Polyangiaceae bacterium]
MPTPGSPSRTRIRACVGLALTSAMTAAIPGAPVGALGGCGGALVLCGPARPASCPAATEGSVALVRDLDVQPKLVAVDGNDLWVTAVVEGRSRGGAVFHLDAWTGTVLARHDADDPAGIVVEGDHVYWTDRFAGTVSRVAKTGGAVEVLVRDRVSPGRIASDGRGHVVWVDTRSAVMRFDVGSGSVVPLVDRGVSPVYLAVRGSTVVFTNIGAAIVMRVPVAGGDAEAVVEGTGAPNGIAIDDERIHWTERDEVVSVAVDGTDRRVHVSGHGTPAGIALAPTREGSFVYWTNYASLQVSQDATDDTEGSVERTCGRGGEAVVVDGDQSRPFGIAVGGCDVYWTARGSVWRRAL